MIVELALITGGPKREPQVTIPAVTPPLSVLTEHERTTVTRTASADVRLSPAAIGLVNATSVNDASARSQLRMSDRGRGAHRPSIEP